MTTTPSLKAIDLSIAYPMKKKYILRNSNICLQGPGVYALLGNKTESTKTLATLHGQRPTIRGTVKQNDTVVSKTRTHSSFIPKEEQAYLWHAPVSILDVVLMGRFETMTTLTLPSAHDHQKARQALQQVVLDDRPHVMMKTLTPGEINRVLLAKAIVQDSPILFFDQPFWDDSQHSNRIMSDVFQRLRAQQHLVILAVNYEAIDTYQELFDGAILLYRQQLRQLQSNLLPTLNSLEPTYSEATQ